MDSAEFSFNMDDFLALADEATLGSVTESAALEPAPALGSGDGLSLLGSVGGVSVGSDGQSGSGTGSALGSITGKRMFFVFFFFFVFFPNDLCVYLLFFLVLVLSAFSPLHPTPPPFLFLVID